jgi:hypothetical protein
MKLETPWLCASQQSISVKCAGFGVEAEAEGQSSGSCTIALGFQPLQQVLESSGGREGSWHFTDAKSGLDLSPQILSSLLGFWRYETLQKVLQKCS